MMSNLRSRLAELSSEEKEHFLSEVPRLLLEGRRIIRFSRLLSNYDFIEAKINHPQFGVKALIEDYDLINNTGLLNNLEYYSQTIKSLKLIQEALQLSALILNKDPKQLAGQLSARLLDFDIPEIQKLLQQISKTKITCLRSLRGSLSPPTGHLISTLTGHNDSVNAVAVTPDGKYLISGSSDNTVKVWDLNTDAEVLKFPGHTSPVNAVAIAPDGKRVISASDNTVIVWDLATGKEILRFNGHSLPIVALAVTPDSKKVVSASIAKFNSIKVWDLETGKEELTLKGHRDLVRTVAITSCNRIISGSDNGTIKVWDLTNGKMLIGLKHGHDLDMGESTIFVPEPVYAIAATLDGKRLISASCDPIIGKSSIIVWNLKKRKKAFTLEGLEGPISALAVTPDSKQVISASFNNTITVWEIGYYKGEKMFTLSGHDDSIHDVTITPDGNKIISASKDNTLKVWYLKLKVKHIQLLDNKNPANDVTITPDGNQVIFGFQNNDVEIYDLEKNYLSHSFCISHDYQDNFFIKIRRIFKKYIFLLYEFNNILLLISFIIFIGILFFAFLEQTLPIALTISFILAVLGSSEWLSDIIDRPKDNIPKRFHKQNSKQKIKTSKYSKYSDIKIELSQNIEVTGIIGIAIAHNNQLVCINNQLISCYDFLTVWNYKKIKRIYDLLSISQHCYLYFVFLASVLASVLISFIYITIIISFIKHSGILYREILLLGLLYVFYLILCAVITFLFYESATAISISPNGKYLISGSTNETIKVWNLQTKKLLFILKGHYKEVTTLTVTPDSKYLISGSKDKTIKIWNLETRKELFTLTGHGDSVNTISITPDGNYLISGSDDKTIKIWDLENREEIFTFTGHTESINAIKVTSNGQLVISASSDKTIQVWDFATRKLIAKFTGESAIKCCAVAPDNVTIVAGETSGNIHFLRLEGIEV